MVFELSTIFNKITNCYIKHHFLMLNPILPIFFTPDASRWGFAINTAKKKPIQRRNLPRRNLKISVIEKIFWKWKWRPKWKGKKNGKEEELEMSNCSLLPVLLLETKATWRNLKIKMSDQAKEKSINNLIITSYTSYLHTYLHDQQTATE